MASIFVILRSISLFIQAILKIRDKTYRNSDDTKSWVVDFTEKRRVVTTKFNMSSFRCNINYIILYYIMHYCQTKFCVWCEFHTNFKLKIAQKIIRDLKSDHANFKKDLILKSSQNQFIPIITHRMRWSLEIVDKLNHDPVSNRKIHIKLTHKPSAVTWCT